MYIHLGLGAVYLVGLFPGGHHHTKAAVVNPDGVYWVRSRCVCECTVCVLVVKKSRPALNCPLSARVEPAGEQFTDGLFPPCECFFSIFLSPSQ